MPGSCIVCACVNAANYFTTAAEIKLTNDMDILTSCRPHHLCSDSQKRLFESHLNLPCSLHGIQATLLWKQRQICTWKRVSKSSLQRSWKAHFNVQSSKPSWWLICLSSDEWFVCPQMNDLSALQMIHFSVSKWLICLSSGECKGNY